MKQFNWIDFAIFAALFFYGVEGFSSRFLGAFLDLLGFVMSFILALKFYNGIGNWVSDFFSVPHGVSDALGFFVVALITEIIFGIIIRRFVKLKFSINSFLDRSLGVVVGMLSGLILVSFLLTLITTLPVSSFLKNAVFVSKGGSSIVANTQGFEKTLNNVFGGAVNETISFLTVEPESDSTINLRFTTEKYTIDEKVEKEMFDMVNKERALRGFLSVIGDNKHRGYHVYG